MKLADKKHSINLLANTPILKVSKENPEDYNEIYEAIENIKEENTIIQVQPGIYKPFQVNKEGITIEGMDYIKKPLILADEGDTIKINFDGDTPCILKNLKITHTSSESKVNFKNFLNRLINTQNSKIEDITNKERVNVAKKTSSQINNICLIKVNKGKLVVDNCSISYEFLTKAIHQEMPGIILFPGTETFLTNSIIKGHSNYRTIGLIVQDATLKMHQCEVLNHLLGGISMYLCNDHQIEIRNSGINNNGRFGIESGGLMGNVNIENSRIILNKGNGLLLTGGVGYKVWNNEIEENQEGVEIISTEANLLKNKIKKNRSNGVCIRSVAKILCNARLVFNIIIKNKRNGIIIEGNIIRQKQYIGYPIQYEYSPKPGMWSDSQGQFDPQDQE